MEIKLLVATIRSGKLEAVEENLKRAGVEHISVSRIKGYGEYRDFFARDWMVDRVRIEIFTRQHKVDAIISAIADAAQTGFPGDGVVAVIPVDKLLLIGTKAEATPDNFWPRTGI